MLSDSRGSLWTLKNQFDWVEMLSAIRQRWKPPGGCLSLIIRAQITFQSHAESRLQSQCQEYQFTPEHLRITCGNYPAKHSNRSLVFPVVRTLIYLRAIWCKEPFTRKIICVRSVVSVILKCWVRVRVRLAFWVGSTVIENMPNHDLYKEAHELINVFIVNSCLKCFLV